MVMLLMIVYLVGFGVSLYISHKREETNNHDDVGLQCMMWPVFLGVSIILLLLLIPEYLSKLVKKLVR